MSSQFPPYAILEIITSAACNISCRFCPQQTYQRAYRSSKRFLDLGDFELALSKLPTDVVLDFAGFSEPFAHPKAIELIEYAYRKGHQVILNSTLVGADLADVERLACCNLKEFIFHLPDNLGNAKIPITETYKEVLASAFTKLTVTGTSIMNSRFISNWRAGSCDDSPSIHIEGRFYCFKLYTPQFVLLPNCDLQLCCMDFQLKHKVGNLLTESWDDIINQGEYKRLKNQPKNVICRNCVYAVPYFKHLAKWFYKIAESIGYDLYKRID